MNLLKNKNDMNIQNLARTLIIMAAAMLSSLATASAGRELTETPASDSRIGYCGRTVTDSSGVSFDWSGVSVRIRFTGPYIALTCSDTKANYFNVWVDSGFSEKEDFVIKTSGKDTTIVLAENLGKGEHEILLQKRTEGEQGTVTFHSFITRGEILPAPVHKERLMEFIGDSYTCGYGTESGAATDPFLAETENCNLTYAAVAARYFDSDFVLISHSGQGIARNYDASGKEATMVERYSRALDENPAHIWGHGQSGRIPDIVVIYLGANDFSTGKQPTIGIFSTRYAELLGKIRVGYGEDVPILCLAAKDDPGIEEYIKTACIRSGIKNVSYAAIQPAAFNSDSDLGASWHPNYYGHIKTASIVIPYISTLTGWQMEDKAYR